MADEISNKTLAILVVAAIVVTLGGTMLVLKQGPSAQLTGFVTQQTGTAAINVSEVIDIELDDSAIDFGTGYVNDTATDRACTMNTEGTSETTDCLGDWASVTDSMHIVNEGNVNVILTVTGDNAATFITGTSPSFKLKSANDEASSCTNGTALDTYTELSGSVQLCSSLGYASTADSMYIYAEAIVPSDANPGVRTNTLTFTASKA